MPSGFAIEDLPPHLLVWHLSRGRLKKDTRQRDFVVCYEEWEPSYPSCRDGLFQNDPQQDRRLFNKIVSAEGYRQECFGGRTIGVVTDEELIEGISFPAYRRNCNHDLRGRPQLSAGIG